MLDKRSKIVSIVPRERATQAEMKVLDAYVSHIRSWSAHSVSNESIRFENAELALRPWVAKVIHRYCNSASSPDGIEDLVARSIALVLKCRADLAAEAVDPADLTAVYSAQAEFMLDVAVGTAIVHELQQEGNDLLARGNNDDAKELNQLQHETRNLVQAVRSSLNESEKERARRLTTTFIPEVETEAATAGDSPELSESIEPGLSTPPPIPRSCARAKTGAPARGRPAVVRVHPATSRPNRRRYALAVILGAILVVLAIHGVGRQVGPAGRDASQSLITTMSKMPGVTGVEDRNPYVLLTVHADFWSASSDTRRADWLHELIELAGRHGYSGLVVRSTGGTPLAEWVHGRGIQFPDAT